MKRLQELFEGSAAIAEDNLGFLEDLYERFLRDPDSVDSSWREKFRLIQQAAPELPATRRAQPMDLGEGTITGASAYALRAEGCAPTSKLFAEIFG